MLLKDFHSQSKNWAITKLILLLTHVREYTDASGKVGSVSIIRFGLFWEIK